MIPENPETPTLNHEGLASGRPTLEERFFASLARVGSRNLRVLRAITRLTTKELSNLTGVGHSLIRSIENEHSSLLIGPALVISIKTGVDVHSLLCGNTLMEWGGASTFTEDTYRDWIERGGEPTPLQEANGNRQLRNLCEHACSHLGAGHIGDALLSAHLYVLMGGVDPEIQFAGITK